MAAKKTQPIVAGGTLDVDLAKLGAQAAKAFAFLGQNRPPAPGFTVLPEIEWHGLLAEPPGGGLWMAVVAYLDVGDYPIGDGADIVPGARVADVRPTTISEQRAAIVTGRSGSAYVASARQVVTDRSGRLLSFSVESPNDDAEELLTALIAEADTRLDFPQTQLVLPVAFHVPHGSRVRERATINLRNPSNVGQILAVWQATRDSALDTTPNEQAARAGIEIALPVQHYGCTLAGVLGADAGGVTAGKPKIATVSYAAKPDGRHLGVVVSREAVRSSLIKSLNAFELCAPLADVVTVTKPRPVASLANPAQSTPSHNDEAVSHKAEMPEAAATKPRLVKAAASEPQITPSSTDAPVTPAPGAPPPPPTRTIPADRTVVAIDFGTTYTAAAIRRPGSQPAPVTLDADGSTRIPSGVLADADGTLWAGKHAENKAALSPAAFQPTPKRCIGIGDNILGEHTYTDEALIAAVLGEVARELDRQHGGNLDAEIFLTYPAVWQRTKQNVLRAAARSAGLGEVTLVPEPVAAAHHYASLTTAGTGEATVAVYDLGGGTFDVAVVRRNDTGQHTVGPHSGIDPLGGVDFDATLFRLIGRQAAQLFPDEWEQLEKPPDRTWRRNRRATLEEVRKAKEALSTHSTSSVYVPGIEEEFSITREELEDAIDPMLDQTIDVMERTLAAAGVTPTDLDAIYLVGGSSRIPLVARRISTAFSITPSTLEDPKLAVVLGAAGLTEVAAQH